VSNDGDQNDDQKARAIARRKLLGLTAYIAPSVLAVFVADKALAQASCNPTRCSPGCTPKANCNPNLCLPNGGCTPNP